MPRRPEKVGEVVLGSAGQALEQLGQLYPQYQAGKRQALLNAFSMQLKLEAAESDRQVGQSRMAHLAALTRLADLRGEEVMLKMANFLPEIEELEAKARIKREGLEYSMGVAREAIAAPGGPGEGVVIPAGVKVWERPTVEKPRFTPYQQYQMGRTAQKDYESDVLDQANALWDQGAVIIGEKPFDIKNIRDLDAALRIAEEAAFVQPSSLAPGYAELVQKLRELREQLDAGQTDLETGESPLTPEEKAELEARRKRR